jgi:hypothetical protein
MGGTMSVDDFDESRRIAPVWRRIMILFAVIAAVPVILWSITAFVRAYVAPPTVPTFRPITATASVPTTRAPDAVVPASLPAAPARALAAIVRSTATEDNKLPAPQALIVEAKATTSDTRSIPPVGDAKSRPSDEPSAAAEANAAPTMAPSQFPATPVATPAATPAAAAMPPTEPPPAPAQVADETPPPGEPIAGPVPLPPHRPHLFAMAQGGIPVPRPRPAVPGDTTVLAPADVNLSAHDYMR